MEEYPVRPELVEQEHYVSIPVQEFERLSEKAKKADEWMTEASDAIYIDERNRRREAERERDEWKKRYDDLQKLVDDSVGFA